MVLETSTVDNIRIITLPGRMDSDSSPATGAELAAIAQELPGRVILDFSRTTYIASAGLRVLLSTTRTIIKAGGTVILSSLSPQVKQVFEIAGFMKIFTIAASRDEAIRLLKK